MLVVKIPETAKNWDRYKAFHCFCGFGGNDLHGHSNHYGGPPTPVVLFDTGEAIITESCPRPDQRGNYHSLGLSLTTSKDVRLYFPDGKPVVKAWLDDGGMQFLLTDWMTKRAVRLDGQWRQQPGKDHMGRETKGSDVTPGIPGRFQYNCRAYIPGPGLEPIAHAKIKVSMPVERAGFTRDEIDHIRMIEHTGQAAMKLTNHPALQRTGVANGADPDVMLKCKTWTDMPEAMLPSLIQFGAGRCIRKFDYLLTDQE